MTDLLYMISLRVDGDGGIAALTKVSRRRQLMMYDGRKR